MKTLFNDESKRTFSSCNFNNLTDKHEVMGQHHPLVHTLVINMWWVCVCVCVCLCVSFYVWISCWSNSTSHHSAMTASSHRASPAWVRPAVTVNSPWKHFNSLPHITNMELKSGQWMGNRGNPFLTPQIRFTTEAWTILLFRCASYIYLYPIVTVWFLWPQAVSYVIS